jgi:hypothetical protein
MLLHGQISERIGCYNGIQRARRAQPPLRLREPSYSVLDFLTSLLQPFVGFVVKLPQQDYSDIVGKSYFGERSLSKAAVIHFRDMI